jgi:diaminohydroxyphosphoribosylaminopyrimidine deaminase/5-amino-6-(5-phosphoribosylamino)uracil reductase
VSIGNRDLPADARVFNNHSETMHLRTHSIHGILATLWAEGIKHVWVEGGPSVASRFARLGLVDEYIIYQAPLLLGGERTAIRDLGITSMPEAKHLKFVEMKQLGEDIFIRAIEERA